MAFSVVPAGEINKYIGSPDTLLIDLREEKAFQAAHIATAVNIPYEILEEKKEILSKYKIILLYCERGNSSLLAAREYNNNSQMLLALAGGFNRNKTKFVIDARG